MKKTLVLCIAVLLMLLAGCAKEQEDTDAIKLEKYAYIYQTVSDNDSYLEEAKYYDLNIVMSYEEAGYYRYDIVIDSPKRAMYDIQVMAIENNLDYSLNNKMMPTIGIFEDDSYNMVPNQVDASRGYVKGLILSGTTDAPIVNLKIRVSYKDYLLVSETNEYYNITVDYDSMYADSEVSEENAEDASADQGN